MSTQAPHLLLSLFLMLAAAKLMAELFAWLRQPAIVGEILAGVIIGPGLLNWVQPGETTRAFAEIGVIFLLFGVGLETRPDKILKVGRTAFLVAVLGVIAPMICGFFLMQAFGGNLQESLFVGTAMVATSVGITARLLGEMGLVDTLPARIILGAAVIDDVLGLLVLAGVTGAAQKGFDLAALAITATLACVFVGGVALLGAPMINRAAPHFSRLRAGNEFFVVALLLCFGFALAAEYIGVAAIVGAFMAGLAMAEVSEQRDELHQQVHGITELMVPFFLVNFGMQLDLHAFSDAHTVELALAVTVVAVLTKLVGCGLGAASLGLRGALQVGFGMVPRGEVGIVVAQIGLGLGVIHEAVYGAVLFMACATALVAPPLMRPVFKTSALSGAD